MPTVVLMTVIVAARWSTCRRRLVNTARYSLPSSAADAVKENVVAMAPGMSVNVPLPSTPTCHCTVGVGWPMAVAVKLAVRPALTA